MSSGGCRIRHKHQLQLRVLNFKQPLCPAMLYCVLYPVHVIMQIFCMSKLQDAVDIRLLTITCMLRPYSNINMHNRMHKHYQVGVLFLCTQSRKINPHQHSNLAPISVGLHSFLLSSLFCFRYDCRSPMSTMHSFRALLF